MHLTDCEHPVRVFSKALGEYVWTRCGKCNSCKKYRSARWVARLENERQYHMFSAFVTLTYNDESLPRLELRPFGLQYPAKYCLRGLADARDFEKCIPLSELNFSTPLDREYFDKRIELEGSIPYANFRDIQLYHKRLNKLIHDKITGKYNNFRFFTVSEYGSTSHRPHFHEILFFDDPKIADSIWSLVSDSWYHFTLSQEKQCNGFVYCQLVEKSANSYVAQYLNQLFDLPSFYGHSELRPRFVCSKRPSIGSLDYDSPTLQQVFDCESPTLCIRDKATNGFKDVPLLPCIKNKLFPRLAFFESLNHPLRVKLYGLAAIGVGKEGFKTFTSFRKYVFELIDKTSEVGLQCYSFLMRFNKSCGKVPDAFLRRIYYISKRVLFLCSKFKLSLENYVCKIERFYGNCEISALNQFYQFQEDYARTHSFEQLIHMYPEYAYINQDSYYFPLVECDDYQCMCADSHSDLMKLTKSHYKNAYIEAKSEVVPFFKFLIFFYAQKCNENLQAFARFG